MEVGNTQYIRVVLYSQEFVKYFTKLPESVKKKYEYVVHLLKSEKVISAKFVKHLANTELYELRVSLNTNEYRTIIFTADSGNINSATKIYLLNSFLKKSTKDYRKNIEQAKKLLNKYTNEEN